MLVDVWLGFIILVVFFVRRPVLYGKVVHFWFIGAVFATMFIAVHGRALILVSLFFSVLGSLGPRRIVPGTPFGRGKGRSLCHHIQHLADRGAPPVVGSGMLCHPA